MTDSIQANSQGNSGPIDQGPVRRCPICRKPRKAEFTPFCSQRCKDRDLLQWLDEGYTLPGPPALDETDFED